MEIEVREGTDGLGTWLNEKLDALATKPARFRKKPVVVDAILWTGTNWNEVCGFIPVPAVGRGVVGQEATDAGYLDGQMPIAIKTLEGTVYAVIGDWIIKGVAGEFYPCKHGIFRATYELVTE